MTSRVIISDDLLQIHETWLKHTRITDWAFFSFALGKKRKPTTRMVLRPDVSKWILDNCRYRAKIKVRRVWSPSGSEHDEWNEIRFPDARDAMLFKLTWGGK